MANAPHKGLVLELGYRWVPHFDVRQGGILLRRLKRLRLQIARNYRVNIPPIQVRDNPELEPDAFRFLGDGLVTEKGWLPADCQLLMHSGDREHEIPAAPDSPVFFEPMLNQRVIVINRDTPPNLVSADLKTIEPGDVLLQYARRALEIEIFFGDGQMSPLGDRMR